MCAHPAPTLERSVIVGHCQAVWLRPGFVPVCGYQLRAVLVLWLVSGRTGRGVSVLNIGRVSLAPIRPGLALHQRTGRGAQACPAAGVLTRHPLFSKFGGVDAMQDLLMFAGEHPTAIVLFTLVVFLVGRTRH